MLGVWVALLVLVVFVKERAAQAAAPEITNAPPFTVDEGTTTVETLTATDADSDPLMWTIPAGAVGGADAAQFMLSGTGVLTFTTAPDYESPADADTDNVYEVMVQVSDGTSTVTAALEVTVENVIELTALMGSVTVDYAENQAVRVATFTASSEADREGLTWSLSGDAAADFSVDAPGGALRFHIDPVSPNIFPKLPDFESPDDADTDNEYTLTVAASDGTNTLTSNVTVTVTNEDEAGTLTLSSSRPRLGTALTATLSDPDTVTGTAAWTWERSAGRSAWTVIDGATAAGYTPVAADTGHFLRVKASYAGQAVSAVPPEVVVGALLSHLAVTTNDSVGGAAWRQMKPAFDGGTLHYAVGCGNTDTMVLTLSAALSGTRVAVNGIQTTSQNASVEVAVTGTSVVPITLTDSEGGSTTYAVHCIPSDFQEVTTIKRVDTGVMEDLIIFGRFYGTDTQRSYLTIIDNNGVPRYLRKLDHKVPLFIRYHKTPDGEWKYSYGKGNNNNGEIVLLDQSLEEAARVTTVAPLIRTNYHDHHILDDGNYLLMAYEPTDRDLSHMQGFIDENGDPVTYGTVRVRDSAIQIRTPAGVAVFTWNSWDAIPLEDCAAHRFPPESGDYAHVNGLQLYDGDIIATFRGCSAMLRIDPDGDTTHKVVWRLGRTNLSDEEWLAAGKGPPPMTFVGDPEGEFCGVHAGQLLPNGNLLIFDNGTDCSIDPRTRESKRESLQFSRAVEYAIDEANGEAVFQRAHSLHGTETFLTWSSGHVEDLANGDWLISWGRSPTLQQVSQGAGKRPDEAATQVDPDTGVEKFSLKLLDSVESWGQQNIRAIPLSPVALATEPTLLTAALAASSHDAVFHTEVSARPTVVVAFNQPVVDFGTASPSLSVQGATVTSVAPHLVAGAPAHAYLVTFTPEGAAPITFALVADQPCADGGICTAAGTLLSAVPTAHTIPGPVTVRFGATDYSVLEGGTASVIVELNRAHGRPDALEILLVVQTGGTATEHTDYTVPLSVTFGSTETRASVSVATVADSLLEGAEPVVLGFGTLPSGVNAGTTTTTRVTIADRTPAAQFTLTLDQREIVEGRSLGVTVSITNGVTFATAQTLTLTFSGSATLGDDYTVDAPTLTLLAGQSSVSTTLRVVDDADVENAETIVVAVAHGGIQVAAQTATIPASDRPGVTPQIAVRAGPSPVGEAEGPVCAEDVHGNTAAQATAIALSTVTPGALCPATDVDYFTVTVPGRGLLFVDTTGRVNTQGTLWQHDVALASRLTGGRQDGRLGARVQAGPVVVALHGQGGATGDYDVVVTFVQGYLENPGAASFQSGIGLISGWVCEAEMVEIELNEMLQEAAYGTARLDTLAACGDTDNGFGLLFNWNLLGDGEHTVVAYVDEEELGRATVRVTTLGQEFLRGAEGECVVEDFPRLGQNVLLEWQQDSQNFVMTDVE